MRLPQTKAFCAWFNSSLPPGDNAVSFRASDKEINITAEMVRQYEQLIAIDGVLLEDAVLRRLEQTMAAYNQAVQGQEFLYMYEKKSIQ